MLFFILIALENSSQGGELLNDYNFCGEPNYDPTRNILGVRAERDFFFFFCEICGGDEG